MYILLVQTLKDDLDIDRWTTIIKTNKKELNKIIIINSDLSATKRSNIQRLSDKSTTTWPWYNAVYKW